MKQAVEFGCRHRRDIESSRAIRVRQQCLQRQLLVLGRQFTALQSRSHLLAESEAQTLSSLEACGLCALHGDCVGVHGHAPASSVPPNSSRHAWQRHSPARQRQRESKGGRKRSRKNFARHHALRTATCRSCSRHAQGEHADGAHSLVALSPFFPRVVPSLDPPIYLSRIAAF